MNAPRCRLACLLATAGALAGCGGGESPPAQPQNQAAAVPTATATAVVTAAPTATATVTAAPTASATPAATATPAPASSGSTPATTKPKKKAKPSLPMICLKAAGLSNPIKRGVTLWSAKAPSGSQRVTIDGPYKTVSEAKDSVETLLAIEDAQVGGRYVVAAPLRAQAAATVQVLADCLDARSA